MKYTTFLILILLSLSSCTNYIYVPIMPEKVFTPALREKGDLQVDVSTSSLQPFSLTAAYAINDHVALSGSFKTIGFNMNESEDNGSGTSLTNYSGSRYALGLGYFSTLGDKGFWGINGGIGSGDLTARLNWNDPNNSSYITTAKMQLPTFFINYHIGVSGNIASFSGGIKIGYQAYTSKSVTTTASGSGNLNVYADGPIYAQPYLDFGLGYKYVKLSTQIGLSFAQSGLLLFPAASNNNISPVIIPMPYACAGLTLDIGALMKRVN
jgi:hypothetical protein